MAARRLSTQQQRTVALQGRALFQHAVGHIQYGTAFKRRAPRANFSARRFRHAGSSLASPLQKRSALLRCLRPTATSRRDRAGEVGPGSQPQRQCWSVRAAVAPARPARRDAGGIITATGTLLHTPAAPPAPRAPRTAQLCRRTAQGAWRWLDQAKGGALRHAACHDPTRPSGRPLQSPAAPPPRRSVAHCACTRPPRHGDCRPAVLRLPQRGDWTEHIDVSILSMNNTFKLDGPSVAATGPCPAPAALAATVFPPPPVHVRYTHQSRCGTMV